MVIANKSHRVDIYSRTFFEVPDTNSFAYQSGRRLAYAQRLYFEYLYTQKVKGTTFFYTLTYNDKSLPHYFKDTPCFSYQDIRYVTNGMLSKELLRKYGSRLRYFVACESGEGKGSRGVGKNPHYHCIFFIQPVHDTDGNPIFEGYKSIHPIEFRKLIRKVWQGTPNDYVVFNEALYGIAKEGDNCGLVSSIAPFKYCSKYVLKDNNDIDLELSVYNYWLEKAKLDNINLQVLWYFYRYNCQLNDGDQLHDIFYWLGLDKYNKWRKMTTDPDKSYIRFIKRYSDSRYKIEVAKSVNDFYVNYYCKMFAKYKLNEYRREYSGKVRCSKSLGEYGINFIQNKDTMPLFNIPTPQGFECKSISLYYYRKLYYDKHICDVTGNVLYRLNDLGKQLKINSLSNTIEKHIKGINESLSIVFNNRFIVDFEEFRQFKLFNEFIDSPIRDELIRRYSIFKVVYEHRSYHKFDMIALDPCYSMDSVLTDYKRFVETDSYFFDYDFRTVFMKLYHSKDMLSFSSHPNFSRHIKLFKMLDEVLNVVHTFRSNNAKAIFKANSELQSKLKARNFS